MPLLVGTCVTDKRRNALQSLLEEVPDVLEEAIKACSAPRHAALDQDVANARDDYGKAMRRKWFGSKRGTVRHTFRDILAHITTKDVMINEHGGGCHGAAHAYTPDDQKSDIFLCVMFYSDNAFGQVSTIIHELTHLVRGTVDFTLPDSKKELSKGLTLDSIHDDDKEILNKKFVKYLKTMPRENSVVSAYNYENFIRELLEECYDDTIFTAVR